MESDTEFGSDFLIRLQERDPAAFRELYNEYCDMVYNVCMRMAGNREDAEDATQEVFLKVYRSVGGFRDDAKLSSWIYRITVNVCLNQKRRNKLTHWISLDFSFTSEDKEMVDNTDAAEPSPEDDERVQAVRRAIRSLPKLQSTAVILQRYEGLSYKEIADIMGKSLSAVEALLHRAKQNLTNKLQEFEKFYF